MMKRSLSAEGPQARKLRAIKKAKRQQEPLTATKNRKRKAPFILENASDSERQGDLLQVGNIW